MKQCSQCKIFKELSEYHKDKSRNDGLRYICKECHNKNNQVFYQKDPSRKNATGKLWDENNKAKRKIINRSWEVANSTKRRMYTANYRAKKLNSIPKWLSKDQLKEIKMLYSHLMGDDSVDHIIPLQGANVSGLHVPWNLQILTKGENFKKKNKFDGTNQNDSWRL